MYEVECRIDDGRIACDAEAVERIVHETLALEAVAEATISIVIVDDATIHQLNREHLQHDYATDVLSFLLDESTQDVSSASDARVAGKRIDGEVVVSAEMAESRAAEFGWSPAEELVLYLVHGLLHLVGYDDTTPAERAIMREREQFVLSRIQSRVAPPPMDDELPACTPPQSSGAPSPTSRISDSANGGNQG